ncbi:MAG: bifunctional folylpolyglutamate synthase/dihydrofolate synthase [Gammaproteobacteria bacterium]|nr:bifunctional folylpolyglutamate synthase/dihydrofolate synthase [Gammaproteobacteria bacterium]
MTASGIPGAADRPGPAGGTLADWLHWQETLHHKTVDLGLDRVREVFSRLPVARPSGAVLTVGGTNGKGSTVTLLSDVLTAAGCRPGLYTSPHLLHYRERIRIRGGCVADDDLVRAFAAVEHAREGVPLTYFEFGTLAALLCFDRAGCDYWVLEVGLGGRLDAVNVVDPDVALITTIGLDHQDWLGGTVEAIAAEKAGILRPGRPAFFGDEPLPAAIREHAAALQAALHSYGRDFGWRIPGGESGGDARWEWWGGDRRVGPLAGQAHWSGAQYRNAALALAALQSVRPDLLTTGMLNPVLARSAAPGRFQIVRRSHEWILDVAHNPQAAHVLREQLARLPGPPGGVPATTIVTALLADKAVREFIGELVPVAGRWVVSAVDDPRASPRDRMLEEMAAAGVADPHWAETPAEACREALRLTPPGGRIIVCGSFRIVAPVLEWLGLY